MGFDIPMNTKGAMNMDSLLALNSGGMTNNTQPVAQQQPQYQQPVAPQQPQYQQPVAQQQPQYQQPVAQVRQRPQGNGVHLKKGQRVNLGDNSQALTNIQVCLGWDVTNDAVDLDASEFMLGADI